MITAVSSFQGLEQRAAEEHEKRKAKYEEELEFLKGQGSEIQRFLDALSQRENEDVE